jgi:TPR repeat protein
MSYPSPIHTPTPPMTLAELSALPGDTLAQALRRDAGHTARWLHDLACGGLAEAQTMLGQMLLDGRGTPAHPGAARRWFALAARGGYPPAANMLGRCLERGWGGPADWARAAQSYRQAAEQALDWGQYNLANMLLRGRGVARDVPQSFAWFVAAADQGHAKSMNLVGRFLEDGWLGRRDANQAASWYRRAAEAGDFRGQYNWATLLALAGQLDAAVAWFTQAGDSGSLDFRRHAAQELLQRPEPALRQAGLAIAARCCEDGDGADYHRYGMALASGPATQSRIARAWLQRAVTAGYGPAVADLERLSIRRPGLSGVSQRRPKPES